ncbi:YraN family protein [Mycolicibacterium setense]|uniref:YraN family protein n=1 Tax=Mycolicibacterium setense TaxID=431269 RepID=UPI000C7CFF3F|nr:YraN family protein [Mycolicibacterium setense]
MSSLTRAEIGALGEQLASEYLAAQGLRTLARNWRCRYGELDVIAEEVATNTVVFVEVKTRTGEGFGGLAEAVTAQKLRRIRRLAALKCVKETGVTAQKLRRIRRLAALWLVEQTSRYAALRIDVIRVRLGHRREPELTHIKGVG